jgi:hypothetical protein
MVLVRGCGQSRSVCITIFLRDELAIPHLVKATTGYPDVKIPLQVRGPMGRTQGWPENFE